VELHHPYIQRRGDGEGMNEHLLYFIAMHKGVTLSINSWITKNGELQFSAEVEGAAMDGNWTRPQYVAGSIDEAIYGLAKKIAGRTMRVQHGTKTFPVMG
jgi:hypothetical protein